MSKKEKKKGLLDKLFVSGGTIFDKGSGKKKGKK